MVVVDLLLHPFQDKQLIEAGKKQYLESIEWLNLGEAGKTTSYHKLLGGGLVVLFVVLPLALIGGV